MWGLYLSQAVSKTEKPGSHPAVKLGGFPEGVCVRVATLMVLYHVHVTVVLQ